ncbi:MAG: hypothetical protein ACREO0_09230 [Pseudoxanthomonas sp.]
MRLSSIPAIVLALFPLTALAQSGWKDMKGNAIPETESARSKDGFSASLVITPDKDWREKWNTPPETVPHFSTAEEVSAGGELYALTFLANPMLDASGTTDVACDFTVSRPDGSKSVSEFDTPCFKTELKTDPTQVYRSAASLTYVAEPEDPRGTWSIEVVVKDRLRGVSIPLRTSFVVR